MKWRAAEQQTEQLTIDIDVLKDAGGMKFTWDETEAFVPFKVVKH